MFPLIGAVASIGSAIIGANAADKAGRAQADAQREATAEQRRQYDESMGLLRPKIAAGDTARGYQLGALGLPGGVQGADATAAFRDSPGYKFALGQGRNQALTSAGASSNLFSGKSLKSLANYGQGMADQQFGNWYGRLGGLSGAGDSATGMAVNAGQQTAGNLSSLAMQGGENRASSYINGANAITGGIQNLADLASYSGGFKPSFGKQPPRYTALGAF